jgi:hypothetical protein
LSLDPQWMLRSLAERNPLVPAGRKSQIKTLDDGAILQLESLRHFPLVIVVAKPHVGLMINETAKTTKKADDTHAEAIARWNNEGGAPGRPEGRTPEFLEACILPMHLASGGCLAQDGAEIDIQLSLEDISRAAQSARRIGPAALISYDLWRFSCEMPDAPHLLRDLRWGKDFDNEKACSTLPQ